MSKNLWEIIILFLVHVFFLLNCESFFIIFMMMKIDIQNDCEKFNYMVR